MKQPWWERTVTYRGLTIYLLVSAPFVGVGRALAEAWLS